MGKYKTTQEKKKEIEELTEQRNQEVKDFFKDPEKLKEYIEFSNNFYNYSVRNSILIQKQFTGAQAVGSFKFWKDKGFPVQKGEKGIKILAPYKYQTFLREKENGEKKRTPLKYATKKEKEEIEKGNIEVRENIGYRKGTVFDISQTNATQKDLPELFPNKWIDGNVDNYEEMYQSLEKLAQKMNTPIIEPLHELGVSKGAFVIYDQRNEQGNLEQKQGIELNPRNGQRQNVKTLIHELAHAKLHNPKKEKERKENDGKPLNHSEKEFQAEMTAFTVCSYFNIDTSDYSLQYLHTYAEEHQEIDDRIKLLEEVKQTAHTFIDHLEKDLEEVKKDIHEQTQQIDNKNNMEHLKDKYGDIQVIKDGTIKQISELTVGEFEDTFTDYHDRNLFEYAEHYQLEKEKIINQVNDSETNWRKNGDNIKLVDENINKTYAYVRWSETDIKQNLMPIEEMDQELAKKNVEDFSLGNYHKTKIDMIVPQKDGVQIHTLDRIDLSDGIYKDLKTHIGNQDIGKYIPDNPTYLNEIYSEANLTKKAEEIYEKNISLGVKDKPDKRNMEQSNRNIRTIEKFCVDNNILTKKRLSEISDNVRSEYLQHNEARDTTNKMVNLQGYYKKYSDLLKKEKEGELTEEKVVNRLNAENTYEKSKKDLLENSNITKEDIKKMERKVDQKETQKTQEKVVHLKQSKKKGGGLSM